MDGETVNLPTKDFIVIDPVDQQKCNITINRKTIFYRKVTLLGKEERLIPLSTIASLEAKQIDCFSSCQGVAASTFLVSALLGGSATTHTGRESFFYAGFLFGAVATYPAYKLCKVLCDRKQVSLLMRLQGGSKITLAFRSKGHSEQFMSALRDALDSI
eukprot:TRINITY_DN13258_c0_g1_i1.p1 TRINITY_DN13258_c0_g1~~TRINITY_DN13258_c0_g1_i1.p1  ORF type:complete len:159 (-),score=17.78 TRINITY_DN13258_c0_g1_i1:48-524(-)